jgi:pilus assembly protein CpaB
MALITSGLFYTWMEEQTRVGPSGPQQIESPAVMIAVAADDLFWGTALTDEMIKLVSFPKESLMQGYLSAVTQAKGRILIANIKANEPILDAKLAPLDAAQGGMAVVTQPGKRAMAVRVDDVVGVAGFINPGNRVDVLVTLRQSSPKSKTVLQNVLVLATGLQVDVQDHKAKPKKVRVITVEVTPEEAEKLALAAVEGTVTMALRSYANTQPVLTQGATLRTLLNSYHSDSRPARRRQTPSTQVELIKGETLQLLTFKDE